MWNVYQRLCSAVLWAVLRCPVWSWSLHNPSTTERGSAEQTVPGGTWEHQGQLRPELSLKHQQLSGDPGATASV